VYKYREVSDGHSWGNWRNLIDDIIIDFFGN
jgi:enterochelin esterase-like enzyme